MTKIAAVLNEATPRRALGTAARAILDTNIQINIKY